MRNALIVVGIGVIVLVVGWYFLMWNTTSVKNDPLPTDPKITAPREVEKVNPGASIGEENEVHFTCADRKTIIAVFARDIAALTLSDGRQITLSESPSASGISYWNNTRTIEFRGKGAEGSLIEEGVTTYENCTTEM